MTKIGSYEGLIKRLHLAQTASCTCQVKTHAVVYHDETCMYRLLAEAATALTAIEYDREAGAEIAAALNQMRKEPS